jgi:hypothetical protein
MELSKCNRYLDGRESLFSSVTPSHNQTQPLSSIHILVQPLTVKTEVMKENRLKISEMDLV